MSSKKPKTEQQLINEEEDRKIILANEAWQNLDVKAFAKSKPHEYKNVAMFFQDLINGHQRAANREELLKSVKNGIKKDKILSELTIKEPKKKEEPPKKMGRLGAADFPLSRRTPSYINGAQLSEPPIPKEIPQGRRAEDLKPTSQLVVKKNLLNPNGRGFTGGRL